MLECKATAQLARTQWHAYECAAKQPCTWRIKLPCMPRMHGGEFRDSVECGGGGPTDWPILDSPRKKGGQVMFEIPRWGLRQRRPCSRLPVFTSTSTESG